MFKKRHKNVSIRPTLCNKGRSAINCNIYRWLQMLKSYKNIQIKLMLKMKIRMTVWWGKHLVKNYYIITENVYWVYGQVCKLWPSEYLNLRLNRRTAFPKRLWICHQYTSAIYTACMKSNETIFITFIRIQLEMLI
jgi:hypothetical protein